MAHNFTKCPVCDAPLDYHHPGDADFNEYWDFACGANIVLTEGKLEANDECRNVTPPLEQAVRELNAQTK